MKKRFWCVIVMALTQSPAFAGDSFTPSAASCKGVAKELSRVKNELASTTSSIQRAWLQRQRDALQSKYDSCTASQLSVD